MEKTHTICVHLNLWVSEHCHACVCVCVCERVSECPAGLVCLLCLCLLLFTPWGRRRQRLHLSTEITAMGGRDKNPPLCEERHVATATAPRHCPSQAAANEPRIAALSARSLLLALAMFQGRHEMIPDLCVSLSLSLVELPRHH